MANQPSPVLNIRCSCMVQSHHLFECCIAPVVWSFSSTTAQLYATHRKGRKRRKRHRTRMRPWWRSPRRLRVPSHAGRVTLSRRFPPSHSTFTQAKISDFQEKRLKSMTASFWRPKSDTAEFGQLLWFCTNLNGSDRTLLSRVRFLTFLWKKGQNVGGRIHSA